MSKPAGSLETNLAKAQQYAARFASGGVQHFIDGAPRASLSGGTFETRTPIDDAVLATVAEGGADDVAAAALAAERAFPAWRDFPGADRRDLLHAVADAIEARAEEIALLESLDTGQPIRFMSAAAKRGAENFRFFADKAPEAERGLSLPAREHVNYTLRQPIGPVAAITPWNTPFMLATWKIAPALAAGCTVVHKPAEWSPITATVLAEICADAGLPAGVLNTVHGFGETAGKAATQHPAIRAVAFVGESATGSAIMAQGAPTLKRLHLELGGKNPVVVFADADLERALDAVVFMIYSLNGERCTSSSRLLVQKSIEREFGERLVERVRKIKVGHPLDPATEIGRWAAARVREGIETSLERLGVHFDVWKSEGSLHAEGWVERAIARLRERGHVYEQDGALWFRSTAFGDDKDRVINRSNGEPTYFAADSRKT